METEIKDCAFQYAVAPKWGRVDIKEDTDLITYEEAKKLWKKYLPDFIRKLQEEMNPEMVIWRDMKNNTDYRNNVYHADYECETDGKTIWVNKKIYLEPK